LLGSDPEGHLSALTCGVAEVHHLLEYCFSSQDNRCLCVRAGLLDPPAKTSRLPTIKLTKMTTSFLRSLSILRKLNSTLSNIQLIGASHRDARAEKLVATNCNEFDEPVPRWMPTNALSQCPDKVLRSEGIVLGSLGFFFTGVSQWPKCWRRVGFPVEQLTTEHAESSRISEG
jgi:hypothetical protein